MRKTLFLLVIANMLLVQGCTSPITSDDYLTHKVRDPVNLEAYAQTKWFRPEKHKLSELCIVHDDMQVTRGIKLTVEGALNTVLYFGNLPFYPTADEAMIAGQFALLGVNFISLKSRGIDSDGNWPSVMRLQRDAVNVYDQVRASNPNGFIILHGLAISTFFVAELARTRNVDAIVLEGALTRIEEAVQAATPWFLRWRNDVKIEQQLAALDNYSALKAYDGPLLFLVGEDDDRAPPTLTYSLYQASPSMEKSITVIEDASQGNVISQDKALEAYMMFIHGYGME